MSVSQPHQSRLAPLPKINGDKSNEGKVRVKTKKNVTKRNFNNFSKTNSSRQPLLHQTKALALNNGIYKSIDLSSDKLRQERRQLVQKITEQNQETHIGTLPRLFQRKTGTGTLDGITPGNGSIKKKEYGMNVKLRKIFEFYAKMQLLVGNSPTFADVAKGNGCLNLGKFMKFCKDYKVGGKVSRSYITDIFKRNAECARQMSYTDFLVLFT